MSHNPLPRRECLHCVDTVRFKILRGQLYVEGERHPEAAEPWHMDVGEGTEGEGEGGGGRAAPGGCGDLAHGRR